MGTIVERQASRQSELQLQPIMIRNIKRIYDLAVERFPQRERLWEQFLRFCMQNGHCDDGEIRSRFARYRQHHANNPAVWLLNIRWERTRVEMTDGGMFTLRTQDTAVHSLLRKAIAWHPKCMELIVELLNVELCGDGGSDPPDVRVQMAVATYRSCCGSNDTLKFHVAMLAEASQHEFSGVLQAEILQRMGEVKFLTEPLYWNTMALRELKGLSTYGEDGTTAVPEAMEMSERHRIERCAQVFDTVVDRISSAEMWTYYLDAMQALNGNNQTRLLPLRRRLLLRAFKKADSEGQMTEEHYIQYVEMMQVRRADGFGMQLVIRHTCHVRHELTSFPS